ncbi:hypothetical protein ES703_116889 [subsurface metagenome]
MAKGPFLEFLRANVRQSAADAYTEKEVATPASKTETMAMLIHSIELYPEAQIDGEPVQGDHIDVHVSKASKTITGNISDPDILAVYITTTHLAAIFHGITHTGAQKYVFDPPILYPKSSIFIAIDGTGLAATITGHFRIGYTLEKVSREDFIDALVE